MQRKEIFYGNRWKKVPVGLVEQREESLLMEEQRFLGLRSSAVHGDLAKCFRKAVNEA